MNFQEFLAKHRACKEARSWAGGKTAEQAWEQCPRADWMFWLVERLVQKQELKQKIARAATDIARATLAHTTDQRVHDCIAAVDRWLAGESADLQAAAEAAAEAAEAADAASTAEAASYAAWAAARTADAASTAEAASYAAWAAARTDRVAQCAPPGSQHADIVRKHLPWITIAPLLERAMQETA